MDEPVSGATKPARPRMSATLALAVGPRATAREPAPASVRVGGRLILALLVIAGVGVAFPSAQNLLFFLSYALVGTLLAIRRPGNSIGWLLIGIGWALNLLDIAPINATAEQFASGMVPWMQAVVAVVSGGATVKALFFLLFAVAVVFPSGRPPGGRWLPILRILAAIGVGLVLVSAIAPTITVSLSGTAQSYTVPNPIAIAPTAPLWRFLDPNGFTLPVVILMVCGTVSLVVRYRRAKGIERQQLRWVVAAIVFLVVAIPGGFVASSLMPSSGNAGSGVAWIGAMIGFPLVPIAIGTAVLRYRLYEIDRIISRTIGWAAISAVLAAVFGGVILVTQAALASVTTSNTFAVAASTLVVAALFQPIRLRVQTRVDRRFNRARYDAERTLSEFAGRLRDEVDLAHLAMAITDAVEHAVQPAGVSLWLRR